MRFDLVDLYASVFDPFHQPSTGRGFDQLGEDLSARFAEEPREPRRGVVRRHPVVLTACSLVLVTAATLSVIAFT